MLWSRQKICIQPIVLQEVYTPYAILLKSVTSEAPAFLWILEVRFKYDVFIMACMYPDRLHVIMTVGASPLGI